MPHRLLSSHPAALATLLAALLISFSSPAFADPCAEESSQVVRVDVGLDWTENVIVVDPETVEIFLEPGPDRQNRVCWVIEGLQEGQTLHIAGKPEQEDLFPSLERDVNFPRTFANSGKPAHVGTWIYEVFVTDEDDQELLRKDPFIVIKP